MAKKGDKLSVITDGIKINGRNKTNSTAGIKKAAEKRFYELPPEKLRWSCPEEMFKFRTTKDIEPLDSVVGQPRAIEAIRLGAELGSKGYNIFVAGLSGTGRLSTVKRILEEVTTTCPITYDYCYVNNFSDSDHPRLVKLPKGKGKEFSRAMNEAISFLRQRLPKLFEEDSFLNKRRKIIEKYQEKERLILQQFDEKIKPFGFVRGQVENEQGLSTPEVFPVIENKPIQIESLGEFVNTGKITQEKGQELHKMYNKFHNEIFDLTRKGMKIMQEFRQSLIENDQAAVSIVSTSVLDEIKDQFQNEKVSEYIDEVKHYILENINIFVTADTAVGQTDGAGDGALNDADRFQVFSVNIVLDNSNTTSAPVITETTPSYNNLFGTIERTFDNRGFWRTDFTKIKAGSILKADQGFVIVNAQDLFQEPGVWTALKRVLLYESWRYSPMIHISSSRNST
jgi:ATP-dependent Lon protease